MANLRKALWWIYGIQTVPIFLVFLGGISRDEIPFWPSWNSAGDVYLHLIFYSVFLVLPYVLLSAAYGEDTAGMEFIVSVWLLATICFFHEPIFGCVGAFFGDVFDSRAPVWHQWLQLLWMALTVCIIIGWRGISKAKMERRMQERLDAAHQQWLWQRQPAGQA